MGDKVQLLMRQRFREKINKKTVRRDEE